jgi:hypothetical protein
MLLVQSNVSVTGCSSSVIHKLCTVAAAHVNFSTCCKVSVCLEADIGHALFTEVILNIVFKLIQVMFSVKPRYVTILLFCCEDKLLFFFLG